MFSMKAKKKIGVRKNSSLDILKFGLSCGILISLVVFFTTIAGMWGFFPFVNMIILDVYGRFGHNLELPNLLLATVYSFIDGFIVGVIFATIYNKLIK